MYKDIEKRRQIIHIAGREYHIRYSLNALRCLEDYKPLGELLKVNYREWSIEDVIYLAHAAMCSLRKNFKAVNRRDFENVRPTAAALGEMISISDLPVLRREIFEAVMASLPEADDAEQEKSTRAFHEGHERALYVDVLGRPEGEYMNSTKKEISDRIDCYLEVKGMKEAAEMVQEFDDD